MKTRDGELILGWTTYSVYTLDTIGSMWLWRADGKRRNAWGF